MLWLWFIKMWSITVHDYHSQVGKWSVFITSHRHSVISECRVWLSHDTSPIWPSWLGNAQCFWCRGGWWGSGGLQGTCCCGQGAVNFLARTSNIFPLSSDLACPDNYLSVRFHNCDTSCPLHSLELLQWNSSASCPFTIGSSGKQLALCVLPFSFMIWKFCNPFF